MLHIQLIESISNGVGVLNDSEWTFKSIIKMKYKITCTWNKVIESSSIWTRTANFLDPRLTVDADPSTPDGVLIECVIRLPDVDVCDGAIFLVWFQFDVALMNDTICTKCLLESTKGSQSNGGCWVSLNVNGSLAGACRFFFSELTRNYYYWFSAQYQMFEFIWKIKENDMKLRIDY